MEQSIINISSYLFAPLDHLKELRSELTQLSRSLQLKGTILLSTEGINLFIAGQEKNVQTMIDRIRKVPGLEKLTPKISRNTYQPFSRMLVKIKKEIISFGVEGLDPVRKPAPKISSYELKKWLDEGKPLTLLDTRNEYEVKLGTFKEAINPHINSFRQFPKFVESLPENLKDEPVVMFCTGGIRCEKAGPFMEEMGFKKIYQLNGGILKYFEEVGGDHYDGDCFVFDGRVGVDPELEETPHKMCFACLAPLSSEDQESEKYIPGKSCPYCYKKPEEMMGDLIRKRHEALSAFQKKLPGEKPYQQRRPLRVPQSYDGKTLLECVSGILKHIEIAHWQKEIHDGLFETEEGEKLSLEHVVKAGDYYYHVLPMASEPPVNADIKILYEDEAIVIVEKPAPLPVMASGRFQRNTLQYILNLVYHPYHLRPVHRLDSNTTGLLILAKKRSHAAFLQKQFEQKAVEKVYLAKVVGHPQNEFSCELPISVEPGEVGCRNIDEVNGLPATTHFKVIKYYDDGTSLLEVRPITGRTNQIRIHLWKLGFPICGETLYQSNHVLGATQTRHPDEKPLCLHAQKISFFHPITQKKFEIESQESIEKMWAMRGYTD